MVTGLRGRADMYPPHHGMFWTTLVTQQCALCSHTCPVNWPLFWPPFPPSLPLSTVVCIFIERFFFFFSFLFLCRAIKNGKGLHSKKEVPIHRVADISGVSCVIEWSHVTSRGQELGCCFTNLENSAVATGLEKVSFHSNPKEEQFQRMFKLPHNCAHFTC